MLFKKKKIKELKEAPLGYWEESSYLLAILDDNSDSLINGIVDRVKNIDGVNIIDSQNFNLGEPGRIKLTYEKEKYEVGFYFTDFSLPEIYLIDNYYRFPKEEIEKLKLARKALTIFMKFNKDSKKSYHLQLKLAVAMVPDLIGVMDESAEKMLPSKWVKTAAESNITPGPKDLFVVHAVTDEDGEVWLHTHGLCRCGIAELEILQSDKGNYNNHYNLLSTFANYLIDKKGEFDPLEKGAYIGLLSNRQPVVVTCLSWTKGLKEYNNLKLGNVEDRENGHNSKTSLMFIYKTEEDEEQKRISKVSEYNNLWGENPIFFISNEETDRMKMLARERFNYVKEKAKDTENEIHIKIALPIDGGEENEFEHIWFKLIKFNNNRFKASLLQEPYNVKDVHIGYEDWFTIDDVTDWIIYTPDFTIKPSNVYLLED